LTRTKSQPPHVATTVPELVEAAEELSEETTRPRSRSLSSIIPTIGSLQAEVGESVDSAPPRQEESYLILPV